jgi:hypothetical protein
VVVGKGNNNTFLIHQSVLESHSEFFQAALKKNWPEGKQRIVGLPEAQPEHFDFYAQWVYYDTIPNKRDANGETDYECLAHLYCLGEVLLDRTFQNRIIDAIVAGTRENVKFEGMTNAIRSRPHAGVVARLYTETPEGSAARKLMVDLYAKSATSSIVEYFRDVEILQDLTKALMDDRDASAASLKRKYAQLDGGVPKAYYHRDGEENEVSEDVIDFGEASMRGRKRKMADHSHYTNFGEGRPPGIYVGRHGLWD